MRVNQEACLALFWAAAFLVLSCWCAGQAAGSPGQGAVFFAGRECYVLDGVAKIGSAAPKIVEGRAYLPVRQMARALGAAEESVVWDGESQSAEFWLDGTRVRFEAGSPLIRAGSSTSDMGAASFLDSGRLYVPARAAAEALGYDVGWDEALQAVLVGRPGALPKALGSGGELPSVGSYENLKELLSAAPATTILRDGAGLFVAPRAASKSEGVGEAAAGAGAYSRTNVQVEGVDEADVVKTDGTYIYSVRSGRITIARAYPPEEMAVVSVINYAGSYFEPQEIYVDGDWLVVVGTSQRTFGVPLGPFEGEGFKENYTHILPPYWRPAVKAVVYNVADRAKPAKVREVELDGHYVSSRKIGSAVYLVSSRAVYCRPYGEVEDPRPFYSDSAQGGTDPLFFDYPEIKCFPGCIWPNYLFVAGFDLERPEEKATVGAYLGGGEVVYASAKNLYVAVQEQTVRIMGGILGAAGSILPPLPREDTVIYKFSLDGGKIFYAGCGSVPGRVLNQFSMDESGGFFRVATTSGYEWRTDEAASKNNLYVLDENLKIVGRLEGIAPGERIYAVRFAGSRAYVVTFKNVDPFFVLDVSDPYAPRLLGALKIPGYSNYLHVYDDNHIIGFGKDTVELTVNGGNPAWWPTGTQAFYTGMKMAIFDVTDVASPVELFVEKIGDRGTDSDLLYNHKALLFSKEKELLAFPVTLMLVKENQRQDLDGLPPYGVFSFQGAYVYRISLERGFELKGRITHLSEEDYRMAGNTWYDSEKNVERALYIDDVLYTVSGRYIKASDLSSLDEIKTLELK